MVVHDSDVVCNISLLHLLHAVTASVKLRMRLLPMYLHYTKELTSSN